MIEGMFQTLWGQWDHPCWMIQLDYTACSLWTRFKMGSHRFWLFWKTLELRRAWRCPKRITPRQRDAIKRELTRYYAVSNRLAWLLQP